MSSKSQKAEKKRKRLAAKAAGAVETVLEELEELAKPAKDFIPMPPAFNQSVRQIMQQAQMRAQDRVSTAMELNSDIPKDWRYNVERGGFEPPSPKEGAKPDAEKREDPS